MLNLLKQLIFSIAYLPWLSLCFLISLPGLLLPRKIEKMEIQFVKDAVTICRILVRKKKITKANYEFEATQVAQYYDENTFDGYMLIVKPVIWALLNHTFLDETVTFFVRRWIRVQKYKILKAGAKPPVFHVLLSLICTNIAYGTGRVLNLKNGL